VLGSGDTAPGLAAGRQVAARIAAPLRALAPRLCAAALAAVAVAGCAGQGAARLPPKSSPLSVPASSPTAPGSVAAAYTAYFPASAAAEAATPARAQVLLAPYAAEPYLGHVLSQMAAYQARHEVSWGHVVPHVTRVTVRGQLARVRDCQDASHAALADSRTHRVIPRTRGSARTSLIATLSRGSDGRWRLTSLAHLAAPCEPVPSPSRS